MQLVYGFKVKPDEFLDSQAMASNDLYNQANYVINCKYKLYGKYIPYSQLDKIMKYESNLEGTINYRKMKAQVSQQTLKLLEKNWKSFFQSIKDWKVNPHKYKGMPRPPKYRQKKGKNIIIYPNQSCSIKDGFIRLNKEYKIHIPEYEGKSFEKFNQVRIIPKNGYYKVEIIYTEDIQNHTLNQESYASIDLGLDNLATMVTEFDSIIINGKPLKAYNQFYNKRKSHLTSIKDKSGIKSYTNRLYSIEEKREDFMNDYLHKASRLIINYLLENKIGNLVVGRNISQKDSVNIGKVNNQNFVQIPHAKFLSYLKYKCELVGINYIEQEESYTSKCDALALEPICKHSTYSGKRVKRGLFQSSVGKLVNADINGSLNILRKAIGDSPLIEKIINRGRLFRPVKIRDLFSTSLQNYDKKLHGLDVI